MSKTRILRSIVAAPFAWLGAGLGVICAGLYRLADMIGGEQSDWPFDGDCTEEPPHRIKS